MINSMFAPLRRDGIVKLYELCMEAEIAQDENRIIRIGNVISALPEAMVEMAGSYDEESNNDSEGWTHTLNENKCNWSCNAVAGKVL